MSTKLSQNNQVKGRTTPCIHCNDGRHMTPLACHLTSQSESRRRIAERAHYGSNPPRPFSTVTFGMAMSKAEFDEFLEKGRLTMSKYEEIIDILIDSNELKAGQRPTVEQIKLFIRHRK